MNDVERDRLLDRIDRSGGATVGMDVPERETVQGREIELREFVFEVRRHDEIPDPVREEIDDVLADLRRERLQRKQRLARADLTYREGERLADEILALDRAIAILENPEGTDIEAQEHERKLEQTREWLGFLDQVQS